VQLVGFLFIVVNSECLLECIKYVINAIICLYQCHRLSISHNPLLNLRDARRTAQRGRGFGPAPMCQTRKNTPCILLQSESLTVTQWCCHCDTVVLSPKFILKISAVFSLTKCITYDPHNKLTFLCYTAIVGLFCNGCTVFCEVKTSGIGTAYLRVVLLSPSSIIPPIHHTHLHLQHSYQMYKETKIGEVKKNAFPKIGIG
jgi:hypothetical protein